MSMQSLNPLLQIFSILTRHKQVSLSEVLVENDSEAELASLFLHFFFVEWIYQEVIEQLEFLRLKRSTFEVEQATVSEEHEPFLPFVEGSLGSLVDNTGLQKLNQRIVDDEIGNLGIEGLALLLQYMVSFLSILQFLDCLQVEDVFLSFEVFENISYINLTLFFSFTVLVIEAVLSLE